MPDIHLWGALRPSAGGKSVVHVEAETIRELFRKGGLSAERFAELNLGKNFEPLTLEQMKELEPVAFARAGL